MAKELVIVESPAKARTIGKILGSQYNVKASIGHIRDLPKSQLGVDVERGFIPKYVIPKAKREVVNELNKAARDASRVYLATDPDREGEAISWHLVQAAELDTTPVQRIVFHELTQEAMEKALRQPRAIDMHLVNAQQARRILDRLVGYKISPLLWQKVRRGLSAGRVQSAALKMVVDREREIQSFVPVEYWSIEAELAKKERAKAKKPQSFKATLIGPLDKRQKLVIPNEEEAQRLVSDLRGATYHVSDLKSKDVPRRPSPPFITSTLQQEAWRRLRYTAKRTMAIAQQLYEGLSLGDEGPVGLITYMRTDSVSVAASARTEARAYISQKYGAEYIPPAPRLYTQKAKAAQEAHEAIRPTSVRREPAEVKAYLTPEQFKLYELIWKRMVASQMANATLDNTTVDIEARQTASGTNYLLRASSSKVKFPGFLTVYGENGEEEKKPPLPPLSKGEPLDLLKLTPEQHSTQPPPRYTEGTLVKALEEKGIGRPSTYAPILSTIQDRRYVEKAEGRFTPLELGIVVSDLLAQHFADIVDYDFTAQMEEELDEIACGEREWVPVLRQFYDPFQQKVEQASVHMEKVEVAEEPSGEVCEQCGKPMVIKLGRYGRFLACTGYPHCRNTKPLLAKTGVKCPLCGGDIVERRSKRKRVFYGCANYPKCEYVLWERPLPQPCPQCGSILTANGKNTAKCTQCGRKIDMTSFREGSGGKLAAKV